MTNLTYTQGGKEYKVCGMLGCIVQSREEKYIDQGDVRLIGGMLMYAYQIKYGMISHTVSWAAVDDKINYPEIRAWIEKLR
jgi:hypothetical protein